MKALFAAAAILAAAPAAAGTVSIGNSLAMDCYEAAIGTDYDRNALGHCDLALRQEGLTAQDRAATLNNRGVLYLRGRNYRAAGRDFDDAVETYGGNAEAWLNKAISALRRGAGMETMPMIERALQLGTQRPALAYYSRSLAYERGGDLRSAYNDLLRARDLAPEWKTPAEDLRQFRIIRR
jgi:tetratricopeptide (TPR) repeat protein